MDTYRFSYSFCLHFSILPLRLFDDEVGRAIIVDFLDEGKQGSNHVSPEITLRYRAASMPSE